MDDFIFKVPKWEGELVFSEEIIMFILTIFLVIVGIMFCIWGYKYFQTICFMCIAGIVCYIIYKIVEQMTSNRVIQMTLCAALTFLGVCVIYFISIILSFILDKIRIKRALVKKSFIFTSVLGGTLLGLTIYYGIYHNMKAAAAGGIALGVLGMLIQYKNRKKQIQFRTYNDVLKMELPREYMGDLEYIDLDEENNHDTEKEENKQENTVIEPVESCNVAEIRTPVAELAALGAIAEPVVRTKRPKPAVEITVEPYKNRWLEL